MRLFCQIIASCRKTQPNSTFIPFSKKSLSKIIGDQKIIIAVYNSGFYFLQYLFSTSKYTYSLSSGMQLKLWPTRVQDIPGQQVNFIIAPSSPARMQHFSPIPTQADLLIFAWNYHLGDLPLQLQNKYTFLRIINE